jgi:hypothetical protein
MHRKPVEDGARPEEDGMHGNFDTTQTLSADRKSVTVTGWFCWDGGSGEPNPCVVTAEIKQSSGPGSPRATADSAPHPKPSGYSNGDRIPWTVTVTCTSGTFRVGGAKAEGWLTDTGGHSNYNWSADPVQLQQPA